MIVENLFGKKGGRKNGQQDKKVSNSWIDTSPFQ
jgi:hypothetical protein